MPSVLVVDDDDTIRGPVVFKLKRVGFTVFEEADGEAGLAAAIRERPDVVLLDWMMPGLSGIEVCTALRDDARTAGTPVILLTARTDASDIRRGYAAGADDFMTKPFSPREVAHRITAVLARSDRTDAKPPGLNPTPGVDVSDTDFFDPARLAEFEDADIERQLVSTFLGQAPGLLLELEHAIEVADVQRLGAVAHKLKGSAATLGAIRMGELCGDLCRVAAEDLDADPNELHRRLVVALTPTRSAMKAYLSRSAG